MAQTERGPVTPAEQETPTRQRFLQISAIAFLALLWGSSFFLMKKAMLVYSPMQVASYRIFIAFISLLPLYLYISVKEIKRRHVLPLTVVAILGSGIPPFLFTWAQTHIASYVAGVLNALTPLATMLFGYLLYGNLVKGKQIGGVLVGFAGAAMVILLRADAAFDQDYEYSLLVVLAAVCYGIGATTLKAKLADLSPLAITTIGFTLIGPLAGAFLWYDGAFAKTWTEPAAQDALIYLLILGMVGTAFALVMFNYLIKTVSALYASTVTYLIPIVAMLWGMFDGETIGWAHLAGLALILTGIKLTGK